MGLTASQVRQDFNCFGGFGQQGYGYNIEQLIGEFSGILGLNKLKTAILIGAGNLGRAVASQMSFEDKGFKIVGMKLLQVTPELAAKHYAEHVGKSFYNRLIYYITSAPIVAMVVEGYNVVESVRHLVGATDPLKADVGTIRADFAQIMQYNVIHASDSNASAEREIDIYFRPDFTL